MSRIADNPIELPKGVEVTLTSSEVKVKGPKGSLDLRLHRAVEINQEEQTLTFGARGQGKNATAMAGTFRSLVSNMVTGVSEGFVKELQLIGVGYRAQATGDTLTLALGYSHPIEYKVPKGIEVETPTQTQILVKGIDKQAVGQVAAEIRAFRSPEPYKGKGVRYLNEFVKRKEAKKK